MGTFGSQTQLQPRAPNLAEVESSFLGKHSVFVVEAEIPKFKLRDPELRGKWGNFSLTMRQSLLAFKVSRNILSKQMP